jgi:hypothetical protein
VSRCHGRTQRRQLAAGDVQIGAADAAGLDPKQDFAFARRGYWQIFQLKGILLNRRGMVKDSSSHGASA